MLEGGLPGGGPVSVKLLLEAQRAGSQAEDTAASAPKVSWPIAAEDWLLSGSWGALQGEC